jgi:hypothetical protein
MRGIEGNDTDDVNSKRQSALSAILEGRDKPRRGRIALPPSPPGGASGAAELQLGFLHGIPGISI